MQPKAAAAIGVETDALELSMGMSTLTFKRAGLGLGNAYKAQEPETGSVNFLRYPKTT